MLNLIIKHSPLLYFTQSLWRDEVFSILTAAMPLSQILPKLTFEPPLFYIFLHFWLQLFGKSEIATRSLSLLAFTLATILVIHWAEKLFKKNWLSWFLPLTFFLNPMLLYYALEVRAYGWYIFFATLSLYAYLEKKWRMYVIAATLGFYTHTYFIFVPFTIFLHWIFTNFKPSKKPLLKHFFKDHLVRSSLLTGIFIAPWLARIALEAGRLKDSWYFPVNFNLIQSVLGNMFVGYEGTPWFGWWYTKILSLVLLVLFAVAFFKKATVKRNSLFLLIIFVPLIIVIGISFMKPLFVNRYVIPVTIAQVFLLAFAIEAFSKKTLQVPVASIYLAFIVGINIWYPSQHAKLDLRKTVLEINNLRDPEDLVYAESPLVLFETVYYSNDESKVYLYNPHNSPFPWYVGDTAFSPKQNIATLPLYPRKAYLLHENGSFEIIYRTAETFRKPDELNQENE